ncbi:flagellar type III secretion system pore protein FliP [Buchnera aphidicola (Mollitrichosiphum nigrofasciatum)]|uniref:flagellar type III secretion system pore protein FliP n=1 Tax=Buchnera aphidicola TaxID=9 RepID=UPI0031B87E56
MIYLIFFVLFFSFSLNSVYATSIMDSMNVLLNTDYNWVSSVQTIIFITSLTFIPIFFLMMTSFTRIIIVFGLLRNAFGTPYSPPNQILLGMALFLTFFIMSPVFNKIYNEAYVPFIENKINLNRAIEKGSKPIHAFMLKQTREKDLNFFINISNSKIFGKDNIPINILIPAFIISELNTAFQIGFSIFMPFLIIDLIVASVLMALGMMMVPPALLSLPFKLILFVLADGWQLLINSLIHSF